MRKTILIFIFFISNFAFAQFDFRDPTGVSVNGGFFLPFSSSVYKTGFNLGLDVQHKIDPVYLFVSVANNFSSRKEISPNEGFSNNSSTNLTELLAGARIPIGDKNLKYFIDVGMGFYFEKKGSYTLRLGGISSEYPTENNTTFGGNVGIVAEYPLNKDFDFVARAKYHLYFGVGNDPFLNTYFTLTGGIKYNIKL